MSERKPRTTVEKILNNTMLKRCKACTGVSNIQEAFKQSQLMAPGQIYSFRKHFGKQRARKKEDKDKSRFLKCAQSISSYIDSVRGVGGTNYPRNKTDEMQKQERELYKQRRKDREAQLIGVLQSELVEREQRLQEGHAHRDDLRRQLNECNSKLNPQYVQVIIPDANNVVDMDSSSVKSQSNKSNLNPNQNNILQNNILQSNKSQSNKSQSNKSKSNNSVKSGKTNSRQSAKEMRNFLRGLGVNAINSRGPNVDFGEIDDLYNLTDLNKSFGDYFK
jgi:hypothetical protein